MDPPISGSHRDSCSAVQYNACHGSAFPSLTSTAGREGALLIHTPLYLYTAHILLLCSYLPSILFISSPLSPLHLSYLPSIHPFVSFLAMSTLPIVNFYKSIILLYSSFVMPLLLLLSYLIVSLHPLSSLSLSLLPPPPPSCNLQHTHLTLLSILNYLPHHSLHSHID